MSIVPDVPSGGAFFHCTPSFTASRRWGVVHAVLVLVLHPIRCFLFIFGLIQVVVVVVGFVGFICLTSGSFGLRLVCVGSLAFARVGRGLGCGRTGVGLGLCTLHSPIDSRWTPHIPHNSMNSRWSPGGVHLFW